MTLEVWGTLASVGTFVVIAATAIAALIQLRHMRSSNAIAALNEFRETYESDRFRDAWQTVEQILKRIDDPAVRAALVKVPMPREYEDVNTVANLFESLGTFVKRGVIDRDVACDLWAGVITARWRLMRAIIAVVRRGSDAIWENFEYLAVIMEDFISHHKQSTYPAGMRRLPVPDPWLEQDTAAGIIPPSP